jgi:hypothetical protein
MSRAVAIDAHEIPERPPLSLAAGDVVAVGRRDDDWPAFVFVTAAHGSGWVPSRHLSVETGQAVMVTPYDTTELPTTVGETLDVVARDDESGWLWCRSAGRCNPQTTRNQGTETLATRRSELGPDRSGSHAEVAGTPLIGKQRIPPDEWEVSRVASSKASSKEASVEEYGSQRRRRGFTRGGAHGLHRSGEAASERARGAMGG